MVPYSWKMINARQNYKICDVELCVLVKSFCYYCDYPPKTCGSVKVFHNDNDQGALVTTN